MTSQRTSPPARTALAVSGASLAFLRRPVFSDVSFTAPPESVVAVLGPAGSGKTSLLLAIAARMRLSAGEVHVVGRVIGAQAGPGAARRAVRSRVAVSRIADLVGLDPQLTVHESVRDAADWIGVPHERAVAHVRAWADRLGLVLPDRTLVGKLPALEATALHLVLAVLGDPVVVVHDDLPHQLQLPQRARAWEIVREIAGSGVVVVASTLDLGPEEADVVVALGDDDVARAAHGRHAVPEAPAEAEAEEAAKPAAGPSGETEPPDGPVDPSDDVEEEDR